MKEKVISLFLVITLILSMSVNVFAGGDLDPHIIVKPPVGQAEPK